MVELLWGQPAQKYGCLVSQVDKISTSVESLNLLSFSSRIFELPNCLILAAKALAICTGFKEKDDWELCPKYNIGNVR